MSEEVTSSKLPPSELNNRVNGCATDESGNMTDDPSTGSKRTGRRSGDLTLPEDVGASTDLSAKLRNNEPNGLVPPSPSTDRSRRRSVDGGSSRVCYSLGYLKNPIFLILELSRYQDADSGPVIDLGLSLCPS